MTRIVKDGPFKPPRRRRKRRKSGFRANDSSDDEDGDGDGDDDDGDGGRRGGRRAEASGWKARPGYMPPFGAGKRRLAAIDPNKSRLCFGAYEDVEGRLATWAYTQEQRSRSANFAGHARAAVEAARVEARTRCADGQTVAQAMRGVLRPSTVSSELYGSYLSRQLAADQQTSFHFDRLIHRRVKARKAIDFQRAAGEMVASFRRDVGPPEEIAINFGDGFKTWCGHMRGMAPTLSGAIVDAFRYEGYTIAYVSEFRTTKACSHPGCSGECARFQPAVGGGLVWGLIKCSACGIVYQRDFNAARNLIYVARALQRGEPRPVHLCGRARREAAVASGWTAAAPT